MRRMIPSEVSIHNGVVTGADALAVTDLPSPPRPIPTTEQDTDPNKIAAAMAHAISDGITANSTPMDIVNSLLQIKGESGHKLVWTRFDMLQMFAIWSQKLSGEQKI